MDIAAFVFAGGFLLMGVSVVVIFRENRRRAAQMVEGDRDRAARHERAALRVRPRAPSKALAVRPKTTVAARRAFVEPEIRDCGAVLPGEQKAKQDRPAA